MEEDGQQSLQTADYIIFGAMFVFTMAIGIRYAVAGQRSKSMETYFVGDRKMHYLPVAISMTVTLESAIMMLGMPAEVYLYGIGNIFIVLGGCVTYLLTAVISVPLLKPLKITSVYEYLDQRFQSRAVRLCGVVLFLVNQLFYMGIVLYAQAVAIEAVTGVNMWISILAMDACAVFYTSLGGIKSVVWTDVFLCVVMFTGMIAVIIKGTIETGGTYKVWEYANAGGRLSPFNFDLDPTIRHTVWTMFFGKMIGNFYYCFNQSTVQRISASKSVKEAKRMAYMATGLFLFSFLIVIYEGVVVYAFFSQQEVEPLSCGLIVNPNQIIPLAVLVLFKNTPGMAGVFIAALYSSTLSTLSSGFSSMSILVMEDLLQPLLKHTSDARVMVYAKISVVVVGTISLLFCVLTSLVKGPLSQITVSLQSASSGPLIGLFLLASFFPSTHKRGALLGVVVGFIFAITLVMGANFSPNVRKHPWLSMGNSTCGDNVNVSRVILPYIDNLTCTTSPLFESTTVDNMDDDGENYNKFFSVSYLLFSPLATLVTMVMALVSSHLLGRNRPGDVDPKYFLEISDSLFFFLPARLRRWMKGFGTQFKEGWERSTTTEAEMDTLQGSTESPEKI